MANSTQKYISLREVGRQLSIPPSTVVYYKDRFSAHIPSEGGEGRRKRYPAQVLDIFRSIREMFENNWSAEQIEEALAERGQGSAQAGRANQSGPAAGSAPQMRAGATGDMHAGAESSPQPDPTAPGPAFTGQASPNRPDPRSARPSLDELLAARLDQLAVGQEQLASALHSLTQDVAEMRRSQAADREDHLGRIERLETELEGARRMVFDLSDRVSDASGKDAGSRAKRAERGEQPSEAFLSRPLVIRSAQGEYLGVLGGGRKHFTLGDFIALMQRNISSSKSVDTRWERRGEQWVLVVQASDSASGQEQAIVLVVQKTITPNRNVVTEIVRLNIDGSDVPDSLLLSLFKQVRDEFSEGSR